MSYQVRETGRTCGARHRALAGAFGIAFLLLFALTATGQNRLGDPRRIAEGRHGQLVVSDDALGVVALDKQTLELVWSCPLPGSPFAVAEFHGLVFVGNTATQNVEVYRAKGGQGKLEFLYNLGHSEAGQPGFFQLPTDMAIDARQQLIFVLDSRAKSVKVFDVKGRFLYALPPVGGFTLLSPSAIAVDGARGEVLVSDYGDPSGFFGVNAPARVAIYSYSGAHLGLIDGNKRFARPQGLAVDGLGRIYLAEALLGQVFVFDRYSGTVIRTLGSFGTGAGQLALPLDVVVDQKSGDVFVTSNISRRVEVFRGAGRLP